MSFFHCLLLFTRSLLIGAFVEGIYVSEIEVIDCCKKVYEDLRCALIIVAMHCDERKGAVRKLEFGGKAKKSNKTEIIRMLVGQWIIGVYITCPVGYATMRTSDR